MPSLSYFNTIMLYLTLISVISAIITIVDKLLAIRHARRVDEKTLFILATLGGSVVMFLTMMLIHHKIRKKRFMLGLPMITLLQIAAGFLICYNTV